MHFKLEGNPLPGELKKLVHRKVLQFNELHNLQSVIAAEYRAISAELVPSGTWHKDLSLLDSLVDCFD